MRRVLRWLLLTPLIVIALGIVGGLAVLFGAPRDVIQTHGIAQFQAATGLEVRISGEITPVVWPIPGWQLGSITVADPTREAHGAPLLRAEESLLTLAPAGLLQRTLGIGALWLDTVEIDLPAPASGAPIVTLPSAAPNIGFLRMRDAKIRFQTSEPGPAETLVLDVAAIDYAGAKRPFRFSLEAQWRGRRIAGAAKLTSPDRAVRMDWVFAEANIRIDDDQMGFAGRLRPDISHLIPMLAGNVTGQIANPTGMLSWLGNIPPDPQLVNLRDLVLEGRIETLTDRLLLRTKWAGAYHGTRVGLDVTLSGGPDWRETGAGAFNAVSRSGGLYSAHLTGSFARDHGISGDLAISVLDVPAMFQSRLLPETLRLTDARSGSIKGRLSATSEGFALADARLILDGTHHAGDAAIDLRGDRPVISLGTELDVLDLEPWLDPVFSGDKPLERLLPDIDTDLVLDLNTNALRYQDMVSGPAAFMLSTRPEELSLDLRRLDIAGGLLSGSITKPVDSRIANIELSAAEIDSAVLQQDPGRSGFRGIVGGTLAGSVPTNLSERGWQGVQARGTLSLFEGQIPGIDLSNASVGLTEQTRFVQSDVTFDLSNQVLELSEVTLRTAAESFTGSGSIEMASGEVAFEVDASDGGSQQVVGTVDALRFISAPSREASEETPTTSGVSAEAPDVRTQPEPASAPIEPPSQQTDLTTASPAVTNEPSTPQPEPPEQIEVSSPEAETATAQTIAEDATAPATSPLPQRPRR